MANVLIEDKGMVIEFPDGMSADEIGNIIQKEVYGKDLENPKAKVKAGAKAIGLGVIQPILSSPEHIGSLMQEFGETFAEEPTLIDRISTIAAGGIDPKQFVGIKKFISKQTGIDKFISNKGKNIIANNRKFMEVNEINPGTGKVNEFLFALGSGVTSLAEALAITKLTGSPHAAAALFGVQAKAGKYQEAREAGKDPKRSQELSTIAGIAEGGLEYIGLDMFFKKQGTGITKAVFRAFVEGSQEISQELASNIITKLGIDNAKNIMDGVIQSGVIGFILGGGASVVMTPFEKQSIVTDLQVQGLTQEEATKTVDFLEKEIDKQSNVALNDIIEETKVEIPKVWTQEDIPKLVPIEEAPTGEGKVEAPTQPAAEKVKKPTVTENLEKRLGELQKSEEFAKDKKQVIKNEIKAIEETIKVIEEAPEYSVYGENIFPEKKAVLKDLQSQRKFQQERLSQFKTQKIVKTEPTYIKQRLADIKRGIREGTGYTLKQVKAIQNEMIEMISGLEAKDKAKFIKTIKNIQTPKQLTKVVDELIERISRVQEQTKKANIAVKIKKELTKTKPVKQGQRTVGKYDYESNKFFEEVRDYSKLNQAKAQEALDNMPTENLTKLDLIKMRILSLKANGVSASLEIHEKVLEDIQTLKMLGEAAKDDADFDKRLARNERVEEALAAVDKVKGGKSILSAIKKGYIKGWGNMHSFYNAVFGKKFADTYNPELNESHRNSNIYFVTKEVSTKAAEIYGEKNILKVFQNMAQEKFELTDLEGLTTEISRMELIDIYNSIKNEAIKKRYDDAFGEDQIKRLLGNLTAQDIEVADMMQKAVQNYRKVLNDRNIEITGRDLGAVENYWPATSEYQPSVYDDIRMQGETPSAMKERAKGKIIPKPTNAWHKFGRHIAQAEHVANLSREYETLKRIFTNRRVKHAVTQKFGEDVYKTMLTQLDNISLNKQTASIDAISGWIGKALNNWITAKLPSPSIFVRQLMSASNYMEVMPATTWAGSYIKGVLSPKATFDYMWKNSPFLEARFHRGYKEALSRAIDDAEKMSVGWSSWTKGLSAMVRMGDISAIIYGGKPYVDYLMSKDGGNLSKEQAFGEFEKATLRAQQSGLSSSLSQWQNNKNAMARILMAFKNTPAQYLRKMADATISYRNGDIDLGQYSKTMTIYGVIQPILYITAGQFVREGLKKIGQFIKGDEEDIEWDNLLDEIIMQLIVNPVTAIPFADSIVKAGIRKAMDKPNYSIISLPMIDDIEKAARKAFKEEPTFGDFITIAGTALEVTTAAPVLSFKRIYDYLNPQD